MDVGSMGTSEGAPVWNQQGYAALFLLENVLRELIIQRLSDAKGPRWYKSALPGGAVMQKYKSAIDYQRKTSWTTAIPHHPIHYLDYPELLVVIERNDNWRDAFEQVFQRKDVVIGALRSIEPLRNAIAHNRRISESDVDLVKAALIQVRTCIGDEEYQQLSRSFTDASTIHDSLRNLRHLALSCQDCVRSFAPSPSLDFWGNEVSEAWWFDDEYLELRTQPIREFFKTMSTYGDLPRKRGCGHEIERYVREANLSTLAQTAVATLEEALARR